MLFPSCLFMYCQLHTLFELMYFILKKLLILETGLSSINDKWHIWALTYLTQNCQQTGLGAKTQNISAGRIVNPGL